MLGFFVLMLLAILAAVLVILVGRTLLFMIPMLHGAVYVPSKDQAIAEMIQLAKLKKTDRCIDIGSGNGRVVLAIAQAGYQAEGCEINPILVFDSRRLLARAKSVSKSRLLAKTKIHQRSLWDIDYSKYDAIFLYGTTYIMAKLEKKLQAELKPGARVISNHFQFPNWRPQKTKHDLRLYVQS